jgi:peptidoglycan/LPS O-acetylase OafA/YrhL
MIDPLSPLPSIVALLVVMMTMSALVRMFGAPAIQGRFASIDGLRGYLAFFVYLHHSSIWYFYIHTGLWKKPPSNLYVHFGQDSVILFFMITGFLFFSKLLNGKEKPLDWNNIFISRLLRLTPLYFFVIFLLLIVITFVSHLSLNEPIEKIIIEITRWISFSIPGAPDINGIKNTWLILAGVVWTLPYEWFFYISLPILARLMNVKVSNMYIVFSFVGSGIILRLWHPDYLRLLPFMTGMITAVLVKSDLFKRIALKKSSSFIILSCICVVVMFYSEAYGIIPIILLSISFALIAGGNSIYGLLLSPVSRALGEITYSIYLLHGITLFIIFTFILGINNAKVLSPIHYWLLVICISPIIILFSFCTFRIIERPALRSTKKITVWLQGVLSK